MTTRIYKSTDGNAPVLNGQRVSMVNVLRKILVDGYGDKPAAGWTMPFINVANTRACFRNVGTGFFLMVDQATPTATNTVNYTAYEIMTSESVGSNSFGTITDGSFTTSFTTDTVVRPWICIASESFVYFMSYHNITAMPLLVSAMWSYNHNGMSFFFGDIEKTYMDDGFACGLFWSRHGTGNFDGMGDVAYGGIISHAMARAITGVVGAVSPRILMSPPGAYGNRDNSIYRAFGSAGPVYNGQTPLLVSKIAIATTDIYGIRGYYPSMLAPCHPHPYNNLDTLTIDGSNYVVVSWKTTGDQTMNKVAQAFFKIDA